VNTALLDSFIPTHKTDSRTRMGKLLAGYQMLVDARDKAKAEYDAKQNDLDVCVEAIKAEAANLKLPDKVNLDSDRLAAVLRLNTYPQTRITDTGKSWLQRHHPEIWIKITETSPVTRLSRLTGAQWQKAGA
jgi:hypothetical protein